MLIWFLPLFLLFLMIGLPVFFGLLAAPGILLYLNGQERDITLLYRNVYNGMDSFPLMAIPFFMLAGELMNKGGITIRLVQFSQALMGHLRGGLAQVNVLSSILFAGLSGSAVADTSALGSMLVPAMEKEGYTRRYAAAITAASSVIGPIIPPSGIMIIYAYVMGESVAALFLAGIVPGVLVGVGLMVMIRITADRYDLPAAHKVEFDGVELGALERWTSFALVRLNIGLLLWAFLPLGETSALMLWGTFIAAVLVAHALMLALRTQVSSEFRTICKRAIVPLQTPVLILGGILGGVFTATEAGAIAAFWSIVLAAFVYRTVKLGTLIDTLRVAGKRSAMLMFIVASSTLLGWYLTNQRIPQDIAEAILGISESYWVVLLAINVFFLLAGTIIHGTPAILMLVPIFLPLADQLGIDRVHFGLVLTINLGIGPQTPPVASVVLITCAIAKISIAKIIPSMLWFIGAMLVALLIINVFPAVSLWLPSVIL